MDGAGNLFVVDDDFDRIVEVLRSAQPFLAFVPTPVNTVSAAQSFQIQNIGNYADEADSAYLAVWSLSVGKNFAQVVGLATAPNCQPFPFALGQGASCNLSISFTPTAGGALTGTAVLTDNSLYGYKASQTILLTGTGQ